MGGGVTKDTVTTRVLLSDFLVQASSGSPPGARDISETRIARKNDGLGGERTDSEYNSPVDCFCHSIPSTINQHTPSRDRQAGPEPCHGEPWQGLAPAFTGQARRFVAADEHQQGAAEAHETGQDRRKSSVSENHTYIRLLVDLSLVHVRSINEV